MYQLIVFQLIKPSLFGVTVKLKLYFWLQSISNVFKFGIVALAFCLNFPGVAFSRNSIVDFIFRYESHENMAIQCSTKVCSFGKQVVEKLETEYAKFENGRFVYKIQRSPMCEYMINFIHKLKHLPEKYMMNSVLENFTILQVR